MYKLIITCFLGLLLISCQESTTSNDANYPYSLPDFQEETILLDLNPIASSDLDDFHNSITCYQKAPDEFNPLLQLTLEEKVLQLFILDFKSMSNQVTTSFDDDIKTFLMTYPVGGVIYFGENILNGEQVYQFNLALNDFTKAHNTTPLFISTDEEGGIVSRLGDKKTGVEKLPSAVILAKNNSLLETELLSKKLGQEMFELGFNMNFAPVLDVNTNSNNPIIGSRAFSNDPYHVGEYATSFSKGLMISEIIPIGKHFPGHGDTTGDSHLGEVIYNGDQNRFLNIEAIPFQVAISSGIPGIMVGHILAPHLTDDGLPATLSKTMVTHYLRQTFHFNGIIITDSLQMAAITDNYTPAEVGVLALEAGCDILLMPENFFETYYGILDAISSGRLSEERINTSLRRIYTLKKQLH